MQIPSVLMSCLIAHGLCGEMIAAIAGYDQTTDAPYVALVSEQGEVCSVTEGLPERGALCSVAINSRDGSLFVGGLRGAENPYPYWGMRSSKGTWHAVSYDLFSEQDVIGGVTSVQSNRSNTCLMALNALDQKDVRENIERLFAFCNEDDPTSDSLEEMIREVVEKWSLPNVAMLFPDGQIHSLAEAMPFHGTVESVALNDAGVMVAGGFACGGFPLAEGGSLSPYAVLRGADGRIFTPDLGLTEDGSIESVAINPTGLAILGGAQDDERPYAAFLSFERGLCPIGLGINEEGAIHSVAISPSGTALIAGVEGMQRPYVAFVSPQGDVRRVELDPSLKGEIYRVAINAACQAIIGGVQALNAPYAALISSEGVVIPLTLSLPRRGAIHAVAIDAEGTALIGGVCEEECPYAALISQQGACLPLTKELPPHGMIFSVAIGSSPDSE